MRVTAYLGPPLVGVAPLLDAMGYSVAGWGALALAVLAAVACLSTSANRK